MTADRARIGVRVLGSLVALTFLNFVVRAFVLAPRREWAGLALVAVLGFCFAFVGYLTWFRFAPRAVRHICGATLFWLFFIARIPVKLVSNDPSSQRSLSILLIAGMVLLYRGTWPCLSRIVFDSNETQSSP
jgi:hypothetical protein